MTPNAPSIEPLAKDLLSLSQLSRDEISQMLDTASELKRDYGPFRTALRDKTMVMLFEKPSLRTRVSFEVGFTKLGGAAIYLDHQHNRLGERESIGDYARNLERWVEVIVARTFEHDTLVQLAEAASIPVINALSDLYHPCQALADALTLREHFPDLERIKLAYLGDGNNVCHSLMLIAAKLGFDITVITPQGFTPKSEIVALANEIANDTDCVIALTSDASAAAGHHAIYTDTWVSMGDETEAAQRQAQFAAYQVTESVMAMAAKNAIFMHCLPAHRGHEVVSEVIDSPQSVVFDQAENRMHAQNAVLLHMLAGNCAPQHCDDRSPEHASEIGAG